MTWKPYCTRSIGNVGMFQTSQSEDERLWRVTVSLECGLLYKDPPEPLREYACSEYEAKQRLATRLEQLAKELRR